MGVFIVDPWCLGVRYAAFLTAPDEDELQEFLQDFFSEGSEVRDPAWARKYIEGAVDYARRLSFAPHRDYKKAARVFGGINSKDCVEDFDYGVDGQPYYFQGSSHDKATAHRIVAKLRAIRGDDFQFTLVVEEDDFGDEEDDPDEPHTYRAEQSGGGPALPGLLDLIENFRHTKHGDKLSEYDPGSSAVADGMLKLVSELAEEKPGGEGRAEDLALPVNMVMAAMGGSILTEEGQDALARFMAAQGHGQAVQNATKDEHLHALVEPLTHPEEGKTRRILKIRMDENKRLMIIYGEIG